MNKPNYNGEGILNLIASIENSLGNKSKYKSLTKIDISEIKDSKNVILMVIDGLGYEFLMKNGKGSIFNENIKGKVTSVFPTSTSSAVPTLMTGLSPQEHGMTAWYMHSREFASQIIPLPYVPRFKGVDLGNLLEINKLFNLKSLTNRLKLKPYVVLNKKIVNSRFTKACARKSKRKKYSTISNYFQTIKKTINSNKQRKFIFCYYGELDGICHDKGSTSKQALKHFKELSKKLSSFIKSIKGTHTTLIITADHGETEVHKSKRINLKDHPKLRDTLVFPLCGEHRFAYCYVKLSKEKEFENYVKTKLKHCCDLFKSEDLLKKGYFGKFKVHKELKNRIGDYTLIMKDHYGIYDWLDYKKKNHYNLGDHGGLSDDELYVPIIVINP